MAARYSNEEWQRMLGQLSQEHRKRMAEGYRQDKDGYWTPYHKKKTRKKPTPEEKAKSFWRKSYTRHYHIDKRSDDYLQGLRAGIMEDKRINTTELAGWAASSIIVKKRKLNPEVTAPASKPDVPDMPKEERNKIRDDVNRRLDRREGRATRPARAAPRRRRKVSADERAAVWRVNRDKFINDVGIALSNASFRYVLCWFIQNEGNDEHKKIAEEHGMNWKKWWVSPTNPKTGEKYTQRPNVAGACKSHGLDLEDEKAKYRRKYKNG